MSHDMVKEDTECECDICGCDNFDECDDRSCKCCDRECY